MSGLTRFLGGSPLEVFIKLLIISFVVGIILSALNLDLLDIITGFQNLIVKIYNLGFDSFKWAFRYLLLGAGFVVPIWIILRLFKLFGRS